MAKETEYCGRCSMSVVVDAVDAAGDEGRESPDDRSESADESRDPFGGARIELSDEELRSVSPAAWVSGLSRKLDELAARLTYRR